LVLPPHSIKIESKKSRKEEQRWGAVIGKPRSGRLEGTAAMDLELKGIRTHM